MPIVLRITGALWILLSAKQVLPLLQSLGKRGLSVSLTVTDLLSLVMLAGGIGLLFLKEWGRWILLLGSIAFLALLAGPSLLQLKFGPVALRHLIFYGIFIGILLIPQAKQSTH